ncbi:DUF2785 domain-containing protein, partial [Bacillus thuringiensis]|nr:DUF2785 domain-containing protein [Bacillus thuringiensis]
IVTPLLAMVYLEFPVMALGSSIQKTIKGLHCILCANIKTFLRTLFFRTKDDHNLAFTARKTERMLKELPNYY